MTSLYDRLAAMMPGASRRTLKQLLERGRVRVDGEAVRRGDVAVREGARVVVLPRAAGHGEPAPPLRIVHEDRHLVIVDKPAGWLTVSVRKLAGTSVWSALRRSLRERGRGEKIFLIHRLDQEASGLLVFAKTERVRARLKEIFARHEVDRHYAALVRGRLRREEGEFRSRLVELDDRLHRVRSLRPRDPAPRRALAREAITRYRVRGSRRGVTAVEVRLETGRKHQIRVQFAEAGHPVLGDRLYGGPAAERLFLHAWLLGFEHPIDGSAVEWIAPPDPLFERRVARAFDQPAIRPE